MKLQEIKTAVEQGKTVHWKNTGYTVQKWKNGEFYVVFLANNNAVGLDYENKLQGDEVDFFLAERDKVKTENEILQDAIQAFFSCVASNYPDIKTGDFAPLHAVEFEAACKKALHSWIDSNQPLNAEKSKILREISNDVSLQDAINFLNEKDIDYTGLNDLEVIALYLEKLDEFPTCEYCDGSGFDAHDERRPCDHCDGLGR